MKQTTDISAKTGKRRCGHAWCSDCATKRGRNAGNRRLRRIAKAAIDKLSKDEG